MNHGQVVLSVRGWRTFQTHTPFLCILCYRSGTGQATAWPPGIIKCLENTGTPADRSVEAARSEAEIVIFDVVQSVLDKTGIKGRDIDFLIINCRCGVCGVFFFFFFFSYVPSFKNYYHFVKITLSDEVGHMCTKYTLPETKLKETASLRNPPPKPNLHSVTVTIFFLHRYNGSTVKERVVLTVPGQRHTPWGKPRAIHRVWAKYCGR